MEMVLDEVPHDSKAELVGIGRGADDSNATWIEKRIEHGIPHDEKKRREGTAGTEDSENVERTGGRFKDG
jgi:hypothetical protein